MFCISAQAAAQIRTNMPPDTQALRLAAQRTEDGSIQYLMGFDTIHADDTYIHSEGIDIVFAPEYKALLQGTMMDFVEIEEGHFAFIFKNPNDPHYIAPQED
jgi:iron-sulfur cluster assembly protein